MSVENQQPAQQNDTNKEEKKFQAGFRKLVALFGGLTVFKKVKVGSDDVQSLMEELAKEEKDKLSSEFKVKAKSLIQRKADFDKFVEDQRRQMEKTILEKKKEFLKEMEGLFTIVDKIEGIEAKYYKTLAEIGDVEGKELPEQPAAPAEEAPEQKQ
jgi:hypothetical protein